MLLSYLSFQEEEDLVNAHRKQVEDTMNIVREVCKFDLQHSCTYKCLVKNATESCVSNFEISTGSVNGFTLDESPEAY